MRIQFVPGKMLNSREFQLSTQVSNRAKAVLGATLALVLVSACSDDSKAEVASVIACERADDMQDAVDEISDEVDDNDLAGAQEEISDLRSGFNSLSSRAATLGQAGRDAIEPLISDADSAIAELEAASDIAQIKIALEVGQAVIGSLTSTVDSTLDCDD
jgi:hypothetical protein